MIICYNFSVRISREMPPFKASNYNSVRHFQRECKENGRNLITSPDKCKEFRRNLYTNEGIGIAKYDLKHKVTQYMIIFSLLEKLGIPYLVIKYKLTSSIDENIIDYRYQIIVDYDIRLFRLGFKAEKEIKRYGSWYMYKNLKPREVSIFRNFGYEPSYTDENGVAWEFGGRIKRYKHGNSVT